MLFKSRSAMPLGIVAMGIAFNLLNACMQGGWIFYVAPEGYYTNEWLLSPRPRRNGRLLRRHGDQHPFGPDHPPPAQTGDTAHYLPRGGMFRYVTSANYFGEIVEWTGFAILTWSASGAVFALWTFANLVPRADAIYKRYAELFGDELRKERRKRVIPFIY